MSKDPFGIQPCQNTDPTPVLTSNMETALTSTPDIILNYCRVRVTNHYATSTSQHTVNFNNLVNINTEITPSVGVFSIPSFLSNVCHITNKVDELVAVVSIYDPSIVMITEC